MYLENISLSAYEIILLKFISKKYDFTKVSYLILRKI